jgi:hypothetical protein
MIRWSSVQAGPNHAYFVVTLSGHPDIEAVPSLQISSDCCLIGANSALRFIKQAEQRVTNFKRLAEHPLHRAALGDLHWHSFCNGKAGPAVTWSQFHYLCRIYSGEKGAGAAYVLRTFGSRPFERQVRALLSSPWNESDAPSASALSTSELGVSFDSGGGMFLGEPTLMLHANVSM